VRFLRFGQSKSVVDHGALEDAIRRTFAFVEDDGFEYASSRRFEDGVEVRYRNRAAGVGLLLVGRAGDGAWGWIGKLDAAGRLRPLNRDTVEDRIWDDLGQQVGARDPGGGTFEHRLESFAAGVRARREHLVPPTPRHEVQRRPR
jgi:hypothetical protein